MRAWVWLNRFSNSVDRACSSSVRRAEAPNPLTLDGHCYLVSLGQQPLGDVGNEIAKVVLVDDLTLDDLPLVNRFSRWQPGYLFHSFPQLRRPYPQGEVRRYRSEDVPTVEGIAHRLKPVLRVGQGIDRAIVRDRNRH